MRLTAEAEALVARARELAHRGKHAACTRVHLVWAFLDGVDGEAARAARIACRRAGAPRPAGAGESPPLSQALEALLAGDTRGSEPALSREELFARAGAKLPSEVARAVEAWRRESMSPSNTGLGGDPEQTGELVSWQRMELDDGTYLRFVELAYKHCTVYVRTGRRRILTGRIEAEPEVVIKELRSPENAQRGIAKRIENLEAREFRRVDPVLLPLPLRSTADKKRDQRASV